MPQIISAISGMKLESGFAYHCSEPQPDIGRTSQTHIHDSTEIFFLVSFTAPSRAIATRPTNVMQIHCVAMPPLHSLTHTHTYTHIYTQRSTHRWLLRPWQFQLWMKAVYCPCINGFKRGLQAKTSLCSQSLPPSSLLFCQRQETSAKGPDKLWMSDLYPPQRQNLTQLFVNMGSWMKPLAQEWTRLSIILNIWWQQTQNKGSSGASSVLAMWWLHLFLPRKLSTSRSTSQIWICPLQSLHSNSVVASLAKHETNTHHNCFTNTNLAVQPPLLGPFVSRLYFHIFKTFVLFSSHDSTQVALTKYFPSLTFFIINNNGSFWRPLLTPLSSWWRVCLISWLLITVLLWSHDFSLTLAIAKCQSSKVSEVSLRSPIILMALTNEVKERRIDVVENEGQAGGSEKDNVNEPDAKLYCITLTQPDAQTFSILHTE